jgi:polyhydroxyalkanoate synthesis repressor PhaR
VPISERHLIKKYANRKLYDTNTSRYITLEGIARLLRAGEEIEVVERDTGRDLTPLILSQIVMDEHKRSPLEMAGSVSGDLREKSGALLDYLRRSLNVPAALGEVERRRSEVEGIVDKALERALHRLNVPTRRDLDRLDRRLDRLAARLEALPREPAKGSRKRRGAAQPPT